MTTSAQRALAETFFDAFASCDVQRIAPFLADDVIWTINGPVDLLQYCGVRRGPAAVLDLIGRQVPAVLDVRRFVPELMLVDGDRASVLSRLSAVRRTDNRIISYRAAQFLRFQREKIVEFFAVIDSFNAVEQMLGQQIDRPDGPAAAADDLVAV